MTMAAYDTSAWAGFALAAAIAGATLLGLVLVVLGLSLGRLRDRPHVVAGAGLVLGQACAVLLASLVLLIPGQSATALGLEIAALGLALAIGLVIVVATAPAEGVPRSGRVSRFLPLLPAAALVVGGVSIEVAAGGGLYWVCAAVGTGLLLGVQQTWAMLVEAHS